jgi:hypothetical protein
VNTSRLFVTIAVPHNTSFITLNATRGGSYYWDQVVRLKVQIGPNENELEWINPEYEIYNTIDVTGRHEVPLFFTPLDRRLKYEVSPYAQPRKQPR